MDCSEEILSVSKIDLSNNIDVYGFNCNNKDNMNLKKILLNNLFLSENVDDRKRKLAKYQVTDQVINNDK